MRGCKGRGDAGARLADPGAGDMGHASAHGRDTANVPRRWPHMQVPHPCSGISRLGTKIYCLSRVVCAGSQVRADFTRMTETFSRHVVRTSGQAKTEAAADAGHVAL